MFIPGGPICVRLPEQRFFIVVRSQMCTGIQKNSLILMFIPVDLSAQACWNKGFHSLAFTVVYRHTKEVYLILMFISVDLCA